MTLDDLAHVEAAQARSIINSVTEKCIGEPVNGSNLEMIKQDINNLLYDWHIRRNQRYPFRNNSIIPAVDVSNHMSSISIIPNQYLREILEVHQMKTTPHEHKLSHIHAFDSNRASCGYSVCTTKLDDVDIIAGPDRNYIVAYRTSGGLIRTSHVCDLRMKPIAWLDGLPIYDGAVLYKCGFAHPLTLHGLDLKSDTITVNILTVDANGDVHGFSWAPPKQKKTGYINLYKHVDEANYEPSDFVYATQQEAINHIRSNVIATGVKIEWEE